MAPAIPRAIGDDPRVFRASALVPRCATGSPGTGPLGTGPLATGPLGIGTPDGEPWPPPGAVLELCGGIDGAVTSLAIAAIAAAQRCAGITAWLQRRHGPLFPPDCAAGGVDLDALVVIHVPPAAAKTGAHDLPKAAELLLRSGALDLVVLDLRPLPPKYGAWLGRLQALAREHQSRVLLLTDAAAPLAPGTGLAQRLHVRRRRAAKDGAGDTFVLEPQLVRDKLHAPPPAVLPHRGPTGLS